MKKAMPWWGMIIISAVAYGLQYLIGGIIGDFCGVLGLIFLALGIVRLFQKASK